MLKPTKTKCSKTKNPVRSLFGFVRRHSLMLLIVGLVALGALGSGLSYLEREAKRRSEKGNFVALASESSLLDPINPFLSPPVQPTLSKEYVYAGERLLVVDDANAAPAPPADLAIWRPATGAWWVMGGSSGSQAVTQTWGTNGDIPVQGDFDGDGKTDFSIFRPSSSQWWIVRSGTGNYDTLTFGSTGDIPAPADFDGDGRTDAAVFRPISGTWYVLQSSSGQMIQRQFGQSGDIPDPKDFDGDGRADFAIWRNQGSTFHSLGSRANQYSAIPMGIAADNPVSGDYDGDGRADQAVRSGASWVIRESSTGITRTVNWQSATDIAVQNDYDGDGKTDIAVWRPTNGTWFILNSSTNQLRQAAWGTSGDIPVPAYFRR